MVLGHPVGVGQIVGAPHDPVAGLVVDAAGGLLDLFEDDVLVEARGHPVGQLQAGRVQRVEMLAGVLVLPGDDLLHAIGLDQAEGGGELAHPEVEPVDLVLELAVVAELAGELDQLGVGGDEHPALAGGDRLRRVERVDAGVAEGARPAIAPVGAVRVGAVLEQEDPVLAAVGGDAVGVEGEVAADVDEDRRLRLQALGLCLEVLEGHAEVGAVAVDELDLGAGLDRGERGRHEGVGGAEHGLAAHAGELERRQRAAGPARQPEAGQAVPLRPALLEGGQHAPLRPLLGVEHLPPQLEEAGTVSVVEPDRELGRVRPGCLCRPYGGSLGGCGWGVAFAGTS